MLLQQDMDAQSLTKALTETWADREALTEAVRQAPPADGTQRVLELIRAYGKA